MTKAENYFMNITKYIGLFIKNIWKSRAMKHVCVYTNVLIVLAFILLSFAFSNVSLMLFGTLGVIRLAVLAFYK